MFDEWVLAGTQARQAIDVHIKICILPYLDIMETVVKWESGVANMGADDQGQCGERIRRQKSGRKRKECCYEQAAPLLHYSFTRTQTCG
jgi:hypothetical protein